MAPSPSPSAAVARLVSKARRGKDATVDATGESPNASRTSVDSKGKDRDEHQGLRASIESAREKLKAHVAGEAGQDPDEMGRNSNKLADLLPLHRKAKKEREVKREEVERGRSITPNRGILSLQNTNESEASITQDSIYSQEQSSLLTLDSESDSLTSPDLAKHHLSEAGYLTLDAPTLQVDAPPPSHPQDNLSTTSTSTLPNLDESSLTPEPKQKASIRSRSPAGRFKDVFKSSGPARFKASPDVSPDRDPGSGGSGGGSGGGGGTIGGLFGGRRGSTASSRRNSKVTDTPPQPPSIALTPERPQTAKSLPHRIATSPTPGLGPPPVTTITPPTPTDLSREFSPLTPSRDTPSDVTVSPPGHMVSHRRARSASSNYSQPPSKLSNAISAPLTPTIEETRSQTTTPGIGGSPGQTGFFSSVFSSAQNAATTLSNSIANTSLGLNTNRSRSGTQEGDPTNPPESTEEVISSFPTLLRSGEGAEGVPIKRPAVETLGEGDLDLSHLGITVSEPGSYEGGSNMPLKPNGSAAMSTDTLGLMDEKPLQRSVTSIIDEDQMSKPSTPTYVNGRTGTGFHQERTMEDMAGIAPAEEPPRPTSSYDRSVSGDQTPPSFGDFEANNSAIKRSGSVRSKVGAVARRKRGSSAGTGNTIAAAIGATNSALGANMSSSRLTGFAFASKKRNRDFHELFRSVPEDEHLIEDYSAALQKEILLHGRLYVSEGHICFNANIFGWVTTLIISFDEVVSLEKKSTAMVFPNAIVISTLHARNVFASFVSRDSTYDLLVGIWKISHPNLKSSLNGVSLAEGASGDKTEKADSFVSDSADEDDDEDDDEEMYDEDEDAEDGGGSLADGTSIVSERASTDGRSLSRKPSGLPPLPTNGTATGDVKSKSASAGESGSGAVDFPGPATHAPTSCADQASHYDKVIKDETINAPIGQVYSMVFGPASGTFMTNWLLNEQKVLELEMDDADKKGISESQKTRKFSYIKPLNASIGPKQTKCIITESLEAFDLEKAVSVLVTTQTPNVPSGDSFSTKTRYCLMWAEGNATRMIMNCTIEWTGKSWLKGPIEKGANDGQMTYAKDLFDAIRAQVSSKTRAIGAKGGKKGRRRKGAADATYRTPNGAANTSSSTRPQEENWGLLEPLRPIFAPVVDIFKPLISGNVALGIFVILILVLWFSSSKTRSPSAPSSRPLSPLGIPERFAAYEEMWQREESELWNWLEERVGLDGISMAGTGSERDGTDDRKNRRHVLMGRGMDAKLVADKMSDREMDDSIRITEERLQALKEVVKKRKAKKEAHAVQSERPIEPVGKSPTATPGDAKAAL